jgi:hypothetical protein
MAVERADFAVEGVKDLRRHVVAMRGDIAKLHGMIIHHVMPPPIMPRGRKW